MIKHIREKLIVGEYNYPFADKVNPLLESQIKERWDTKVKPSNIHAHFTGFHFDRDNKSAQNLSRWVGDLIRKDFTQSPVDLTCVELWGVLYNKGDYIERHQHYPSLFSFVYFVNAPKGSSPLVFHNSGHKIKAETGKVVIFESRLIHKVPPNKSTGRCIISGNFIYAKNVGTFGLQ
tara:strand:+ start:942 stop:1472 length:531 start_codon:yes stop_codon:yes gene_type:complete